MRRPLWLFAAIAFAGCTATSNSLVAIPRPATESGARAHGPTFRTFTAGHTPGFPSYGLAWDIAAGPAGTMWFTDVGTRAIGRISAGGKIAEFTTGLKTGAEPFSIVAGGDGNLWFSDLSGAIGRITPSGVISEFGARELATSRPAGIAPGGGAMWAISTAPHSVLVRATFAGKLSVYAVPSDLSPDGTLASDAAGNLWFLALRKGQASIVRRIPDGRLTVHRTGLLPAAEPCCPNYPPKRMVVGPDGNLWFTTLFFTLPETPGQWIGTIVSGRAQFFGVDRRAIPYPAYASGITTSGRHLWMAGDDPFQLNGALWRVDTGGHQTAYPVPYNPIALAADANGNPWFTSQCCGNPSQIVEASFQAP